MHVVLLLLHDPILNLSLIILLDVLDEELTDLSVVLHKRLPNTFSEHVAADVGFTLVDKECFLVVCAVICSNNSFIGKLNHEFGATVDFKANVNITFLDKDNFLNLFKFSEHDSLLGDEDWFDILKDLHDELSVVLVIPRIVSAAGVEHARRRTLLIGFSAT